MGTTDGNGVYTPDLDEEGWDAEVATNFDLFSQNITDTAAHIADTTAAHAASAISFSPTGTVAATTVQTAIAEVASEAAPTGADYLVGTTQGGLSAEIVVGATPGGELGGTWASPTVDATHSGSAHHAAATEGTGIDISGQVISVDLSEISAGGELGGTMDAPTVDASHAGGTHAATQAAAEATAASALTTHAGAADPHTGYVLESATRGGVGALQADVATAEGTTTLTYTDLTTPGPAVTVTIGASGIALVLVSAQMINSAASDGARMSVSVGGATALDIDGGLIVNGSAASSFAQIRSVGTLLATGLTPGSVTFTAKYRAVTGGTATFTNRRIIVIPL